MKNHLRFGLHHVHRRFHYVDLKSRALWYSPNLMTRLLPEQTLPRQLSCSHSTEGTDDNGEAIAPA